MLREVDEIAGTRKRSRFVEEAVREKLERERLGRALRRTAGVIDPRDHPEWATPEKVSEWVRESRRRDDEATERKLNRARR